MRASKARAGHRAGDPCHRRWSTYGTSREYREAPSNTRGGSRMPELGSYGSVRGVTRVPTANMAGITAATARARMTQSGHQPVRFWKYWRPNAIG